MKRFYAWLLVMTLLFVLFPACGSGAAPSAGGENPAGSPGIVEKAEASEQSKSPAIRPLMVKREAAELSAVGKVEPWEDYWLSPRTVKEDLSGAPGLAYSLIMGDDTYFAAALPPGYDPAALLEWGKDPGLNVDILHAHGFTGKGAVIAYIDQPVVPHEEYDRENIHVTNTGEQTLSMHGPAVLSLLAGEHTGVAPEAEVYYFGLDSGSGEVHRLEAEGLYRVMALNETLPEGEKITMVGFSHNIDSTQPYAEEFRTAAEACREAGIMVWFCGENGAVAFLPCADKNNPDNLMIDQWGGGLPSLAYVPDAGRTVAATVGLGHYIYFSTGGLSWTMPYALGLYAIALSIDPSLSQEELRQLNLLTAYRNAQGISILNPVGFVAAVLERVGRNREAEELLEEVKARQRYLYAVLNLETMESEDREAVFAYLAWMTEAKVLVVDASRYQSPEELYDAIRQDALDRGGSLAGIQLFGDRTAVPAPPEGSDAQFPILRFSRAAGAYAPFFREYREAVLRGELTSPEAYSGELFTPNYAGMAISTARGELG